MYVNPSTIIGAGIVFADAGVRFAPTLLTLTIAGLAAVLLNPPRTECSGDPRRYGTYLPPAPPIARPVTTTRPPVAAAVAPLAPAVVYVAPSGGSLGPATVVVQGAAPVAVQAAATSGAGMQVRIAGPSQARPSASGSGMHARMLTTQRPVSSSSNPYGTDGRGHVQPGCR